MEKILFIINPAGNGGAGLKVWKEFRQLWAEDIPEDDVIITERPRHAVEIAGKAEGYSIIAAVGGDGTVNEVMEGLMQNKNNPFLAILPAGTGNDISRNVGIKSLNDAVQALKDKKSRKYDILEVRYGQEIKYSFLVNNFGFSGSHRIKPWMKRILGATGAYYLATFLEILLFKPWDMTIKWAEGEYSGKTTIVLLANVEKTSGGSMVVGPKASHTDGKITVTIIPFKSKLDCLFVKFPKTPKGTIVEETDVKYFQTEEIHIQTDPLTDMDSDGELRGITPASIKVLPLSIDVVSLI